MDFEPKFSGFHDLMKFRVREILLVSSKYDAFVLEEDGRLAERIMGEYIDMHLRFIPRITKVSTAEEALRTLKKRPVDLVITMARISDMNPVEFGRKVKEAHPQMPIVLLTYDIIDPILLKSIRNVRTIDRVFHWSGESKILLAVTKYVEDLKNAPDDTRAGVQVILVIDDSPKFYSIFLPAIYTEIMLHTRTLISDGVNDLHRMLRMRARPKILLAESYEEGMEIYEKYKQNLLGIISDIRFPKKGVMRENAGLRLAEKVKREVPDLPVLLLSSEKKNRAEARKRGAEFLDKNSANLIMDLRSFILNNFGFGEFVFRYPDGREIRRAGNLPDMVQAIEEVPGESLVYHARRNHISIWLRARSEFELADQLRPKKVSDFKNVDDLRRFIATAIDQRIQQLQMGVIKDFGSSQLARDNSFILLGNGSLGGKGRGIAFLNALFANTRIFEKYQAVRITIPPTFVLGTEVYEEFLQRNELQKFAIETDDEELISKRFLKGEFPENIQKDLLALLSNVTYPLAIRSSSLLEDSHLSPFAGLYKTYMLPNNHRDIKVRLRQLLDAIRLVYASVFYRDPKHYIKNTDFRIEEEKMAVVIQQLAGKRYGDKFYPVLSGVAQSYNFYPISHMTPEDGIVHLALGLGKAIVDGEKIYRFSPAYPQIAPPYSSAKEFLRNSQNCFFALDLSRPGIKVKKDEHFSLKKLNLSEAEKDGTLRFVGSTYSTENQNIQDTLSIPGPRMIRFANILQYKVFPLAEILSDLLQLGKESFATQVEIEFAVNLSKKANYQPEIYVLQIRPIDLGNESYEVSVSGKDIKHAICASEHALGNGFFNTLHDLVYVDPERFDIAKSRQIAQELEKLNARFAAEKRNYILVGFGRWGTADPWLGIPVEWHQVSQVKVLIEANLPNFKVEPSLGSHFFHNLISLRLGYLHLNSNSPNEFIDWQWIREQPVSSKTRFLNHVRFDNPLQVKIDGKSSRAVILKPE